MSNIPKTVGEWKRAALNQLWVKVCMGILTAFAVFAMAQGGNMIDRKILDTVKPSLDTLAKKVETTDEKVEKVDEKLDALIQVMIQAFPEFKEAAQARAREKTDSKEIQNSLSGGNR